MIGLKGIENNGEQSGPFEGNSLLVNSYILIFI